MDPEVILTSLYKTCNGCKRLKQNGQMAETFYYYGDRSVIVDEMDSKHIQICKQCSNTPPSTPLPQRHNAPKRRLDKRE